MPETDFLRVFQEVTKALPVYADLSTMLFVQYRNLYSGANTMTRAGLTSPGYGTLRNFPASICPDGTDLVEGSPTGENNTTGASSVLNQIGTILSTAKPLPSLADSPVIASIKSLLGML